MVKEKSTLFDQGLEELASLPLLKKAGSSEATLAVRKACMKNSKLCNLGQINS